MFVVIVDASPLARNLYRLLLQQVDAGVRIVDLQSMEQLAAFDDEEEQFALAIIDAQSLEGYGANYRALWTDVTRWASLQKIIVIPPGAAHGPHPWDDLPTASLLRRPFREEAFLSLVQGSLS